MIQCDEDDTVLFMTDLSPSWKAETIALLVNKVLVKEDGASSLQAGQIRVALCPNKRAQLEFASARERQEIEDSYQGIAIPHTHGYHYYQFSQTADNNHIKRKRETNNTDDTTTSSSQDEILRVPSPPLHLQILAVPHKELRRRLADHKINGKSMNQFLREHHHQNCKVWIHCFLVHTLLQSIPLQGNPPQRPCHQQAGIPVATGWTNRLWQALRQIPTNGPKGELSWPPAPKQRKGVQSSHYLTIRRQHPSHQDHLWQLCRDLLQATLGGEPPAYNALAITKNFVGSPHIDAHDQTCQHVIAVGDFTGGRLCCELDGDGREELQIDIFNRVGRMDGRKVHWVSAWEGRGRYSVVYYSTAKEDWTPPIPQSRHVEWMQEQIEDQNAGSDILTVDAEYQTVVSERTYLSVQQFVSRSAL